MKRVISAIQLGNLNVQPVIDAKNPQLVNVPLPPPTKESRNETIGQATRIGQKMQDGVRNARQTCHKKLQSLKNTARPDDLKKAEKRMEEVVKKHKATIDKIVETAKKTITEG